VNHTVTHAVSCKHETKVPLQTWEAQNMTCVLSLWG